MGANLGGAELETELDRASVDLAPRGIAREAELPARDVDQVEFGLLGGHREGRLAEHVVRPGADLPARLLDGLAELIGSPETGADGDGDGLPDREGPRGPLLDHQTTSHDRLRDPLAQITIFENETDVIIRPAEAGDIVCNRFHDFKRGPSRLDELTFRACHDDTSLVSDISLTCTLRTSL